ncbi:hypothetical protein EV363DRAFT_1298879 [Boletus edulis]|nr:hypothetical protein EV363DRAFT_1298879 [Boletus edulis]
MQHTLDSVFQPGCDRSMRRQIARVMLLDQTHRDCRRMDRQDGDPRSAGHDGPAAADRLNIGCEVESRETWFQETSQPRAALHLESSRKREGEASRNLKRRTKRRINLNMFESGTSQNTGIFQLRIADGNSFKDIDSASGQQTTRTAASSRVMTVHDINTVEGWQPSTVLAVLRSRHGDSPTFTVTRESLSRRHSRWLQCTSALIKAEHNLRRPVFVVMQLIHANAASLNAWHQQDLMSAVTHFSQETQDANHHRLANLALVRARLKQWDLSEQDGRASIEIQPTILAHIAVSIALGGQGQLASAKQEFNQAFRCHGHEDTCLLLLIKSIIIFVAGDRNEATRRVADLVKACEEADKPLCSVVQACVSAQMQFLIGQTALYEQDYEKALSSFASVGALAPFLKLPGLGTISLIFGWDFDSLLLVIRQQTCEALYATSRMSEAVQSLQTLSNEFGAEIRASAELSNWLQSFTRRCVDALRTGGDAAMASGKHDEAIARYSAALSVSPTSQADLVVKRNKARLAIGAWDDATKDLDEAGASRFTVYTQIGEALLGAGRVNEATEMLRGLKGDLGNDGTMDGKQGDRFTGKCGDSNGVIQAEQNASRGHEYPRGASGVGNR